MNLQCFPIRRIYFVCALIALGTVLALSFVLNVANFSVVDKRRYLNLQRFRDTPLDKVLPVTHYITEATGVQDSPRVIYLPQTKEKPDTTSISVSTGKPTQSEKPNALEIPRTSEVPKVNGNFTFDCLPTPFVWCKDRVPTKIRASGSATKKIRIAAMRMPSWVTESDHFNFSYCPYKNCIFDGELITEKTEVVVVDVVELAFTVVMPPRWPHQLYVATAWESPVHMFNSVTDSGQTSEWNSAFNLTMTYRVDADMFSPYGHLLYTPPDPRAKPDYYALAKNKTKTAFWLVSNCDATSHREMYVKEMKKYIDVDIYGACGESCGERCLTDLPRMYKFYLAFENSFCTDYVTEKLFKIYKPELHVIPVVLGKLPYNSYFPKSTFVNTADFPTPEALALHLKDLGSDLTRYSRYLEEKDKYVSHDTGQIGCMLCEYFSTKKIQRKVYNLREWMSVGHCDTKDEVDAVKEVD
ncbi:alpha-(1,3)-fucosyltransferase C-like isoform X2 [Physella acuta]|uniref:alpha-(1,3)-fucosyltransferase C-like isoform X2 n=1 Tax=Physella acuta TaxID=109671 RepID=UPI0027DDA71B|nr:alpha-(1,3)-fucosyltransferase C-like isoform X2 [Physella acuta]